MNSPTFGDIPRLEKIRLKRGPFELGPLDFEASSTGLFRFRGRNGTGKTTLMMAILGRVPLVSGRILGFDGPLGCVGLGHIFFGFWTVRENWLWFCELAGFEVPALELEKHSKLMDRPFAHLSQGQQRICELDLILSLPFRVFLLDEPLSPLDQTLRSAYAEHIHRRSKDSCIIMTTHDTSDDQLSWSKVLELQE